MAQELKFTEDELPYIMHDGGLYDDNSIELFTVITKKILNYDLEKAYVDIDFVIQDVKTGKKYTAFLRDSLWIGQAENNAKVVWNEVA